MRPRDLNYVRPLVTQMEAIEALRSDPGINGYSGRLSVRHGRGRHHKSGLMDNGIIEVRRRQMQDDGASSLI